MMEKSRFYFVSDTVVRTHLDRAFELILELITLLRDKKYGHGLESSFRKTIIIYTASIIEALLLLILKNAKTADECGFLKEDLIKILYEINDTDKIVLVRKKNIPAKFNKLNLAEINRLCKEHKLISAYVHQGVEQVREMRNKQHLGGLDEIEVDYKKGDLDFVFSVARETIVCAEKALGF